MRPRLVRAIDGAEARPYDAAMDLARRLAYSHRSANVAQRGVQRVAATRWGAWTLARILPPLDSGVQQVSGGRSSLLQLLGGLPMLDVTTTGRRSGLPRTTHLLAVPHRGGLAIIGTNFGGPSTPAWVHNLEADPTATVTYRSTTVPVRARAADDAERHEVFTTAAGIYDGYRTYPERIRGREIRVFVLEPMADA